MKNAKIYGFAFFVLISFLPQRGLLAAGWDALSPQEKQTLQGILDHWAGWVPERQKKGTAPLISFEELYAGLGQEEKKFLDRVRAVRPAAPLKNPSDLKRIEGQAVEIQGQKKQIDPQYLPPGVYRAYDKMMQAMQKDLGKRLWVDSGYRSPAYQLYTFLFFLPKHGYSLKETNKWVALPGHSEHGNPERQAVDFINEQGINGDTGAEDFERLPEYGWLRKNASQFGFELSFPRGREDTTFEPWHWRCVLKKEETP